MASVIDFSYYRETGEIKTPNEVDDLAKSSLQDLEELAQAMGLATDELFIELMTRVEHGQSLRDIPTDVLIVEMMNRVGFMELLCHKAVEMINNSE